MGLSQFRVGLVGMGRMGANMARRLADKGCALTAVYDADSMKGRSLAHELGCEAAQTAARVAEMSNTVFTVISDDSGMRQIYTPKQTDSLLAQAKGRLFINCATLSPQVHVDVEAMVEQHGGMSLEACLHGEQYYTSAQRDAVSHVRRQAGGVRSRQAAARIVERHPPLDRPGR